MNNKNYLSQLTWIRGVAAFVVVIAHVTRATEVSYTVSDEAVKYVWLSIFDLGTFGVLLFFALSGCTLCISNGNSLTFYQVHKFYMKRFFRIWPAYVVSLFLYILFRWVFQLLYVEPIGAWIENQFFLPIDMSVLLAYLTLVFNITGQGEVFNNAYWSLPIELQYYLLFPILIFSVRYVGIWAPLVIGSLLYFVPMAFEFHTFNPQVFSLAFSFCGGVIVGSSLGKSKLSFVNGWSLLSILLCFLFVTLVSNSYIDLSNIPVVSNLWNLYGIMAIVTCFIVLHSKVSLPNRLESFLEHYGNISYSTYLYHNIFIGVAVLAIINFPIESPLQRVSFTLCFTLIATYFLASLSYKYIEQPFIRHGRNLFH